MARKKVWIEVALNGAWPRALQPNIPVTAAEIIAEGVACVNAGAAIVHAHTLDPVSGRQNTDPDNCQTFITGIQRQVDAIVYPTAVGLPMPDDAALRCATTDELTRRGALEWGVLDPGSCNFSTRESGANLFGSDGDVYINGPRVLRASAERAAQNGWRPAYACYEPGFIREGAKLYRDIPGLKTPVFRFMLSSGFTFCFPPRDWAVEALARLMTEEAPGAPWMVAGLHVDLIPLIPAIVALGGHVRVGLEDAAFQCPRGNVELVAEAADAIRAAGGEPATATEIRASLAMADAARVA
ncbi:MAG: 3-keto-5-aminohexanoate cleavage protein [Gammaproteobacteria bacterium]|nr:3-keto-5-aminohexanoate cleavage protein [Gammaproteobacteria bacterium]